MMHDRDSCAKLTSFKIYKLSHRTQAAGQSVEARHKCKHNGCLLRRRSKEKKTYCIFQRSKQRCITNGGAKRYISSVYFTITSQSFISTPHQGHYHNTDHICGTDLDIWIICSQLFAAVESHFFIFLTGKSDLTYLVYCVFVCHLHCHCILRGCS